MSVYTRLIDGVTGSLPTFHRYLKAQAGSGTRSMHYYILRTACGLRQPVVRQSRLRAILRRWRHWDRLRICGARALSERWVDVSHRRKLPAPLRRRDGVHPYILLNPGRTRHAAMAHELGHTMHATTEQNAAVPAGRLSTFVAEVALRSRSLLVDYMLKQIQDRTRGWRYSKLS